MIIHGFSMFPLNATSSTIWPMKKGEPTSLISLMKDMQTEPLCIGVV